jgi:hypothetical protein
MAFKNYPFADADFGMGIFCGQNAKHMLHQMYG